MPESWSRRGSSGRGEISSDEGMTLLDRRDGTGGSISLGRRDDDRRSDAMAYSVPDLAYPFDALEPHIDARTMEIHHDKHHGAYVANLNAALEGTEWMDRPIDSVLSNLEIIPTDKRK